MRIVYEWDCETACDEATDDNEEGECLDHNHCDTLEEALRWSRKTPEPGERFEVVLVRDDIDAFGVPRTWAYLKDGKLPERFLDAAGGPGIKVPQRFHQEVARAFKK